MKLIPSFLVRFLVFALITCSGVVHAQSARPDLDAAPIIQAPIVDRLSNGLQVVWFINDAIPVLDLIYVVHAGYRYDPPGKAGTAVLTSAVMDRGAGGLTAAQISSTLESLGASRFADADDDEFTIGVHGLAPDAITLVDMTAKIVSQPDFPPSEVDRERLRLLDRVTHIGDTSDSLASLAINRQILAGTPYGRSNFLTAHELKSVTRADVLRFYKERFIPSNSILMIVGRADRATLGPFLEKSLAQWRGKALPQKRFTPGLDPITGKKSPVYTDPRTQAQAGTVLVVGRPGLNQAQVRMGFPGPLVQTPDRYAIAVGNALLGEYFNSRLNSVIRDQLGLTYSIGSSFSYNQASGRFVISSATRNEVVGELIAKTREILQKFRGGEISEEEVETAKNYLIGGYPLSVSTLGAVASRWMAGFLFGLGDDYINGFVPHVRAITRDQIVQAMKNHLTLEKMKIVVSGDVNEIKVSLKKSGFKKMRVIGADDLD